MSQINVIALGVEELEYQEEMTCGGQLGGFLGGWLGGHALDALWEKRGEIGSYYQARGTAICPLR